jgi:hypothetical protein
MAVDERLAKKGQKEPREGLAQQGKVISALPVATQQVYEAKGRVLEQIEDLNRAGRTAFDGNAAMMAKFNKDVLNRARKARKGGAAGRRPTSCRCWGAQGRTPRRLAPAPAETLSSVRPNREWTPTPTPNGRPGRTASTSQTRAMSELRRRGSSARSLRLSWAGGP